MSERNGAVAGPSIDPGSGPPEERRRAIRQAPEEEQGTLSWQEDADRITCVATVLSLSGQGAAVLAEQSPGVSQVVWLGLESGSGAIQELEARSVAVSEDPTGRRLVRIRFTSWVALDRIKGQQSERRMWRRYPAREKHAALTWTEGKRERTVPAELLNISGGGAALVTSVEPPFDKPTWFGLEAAAGTGDPVESRVIGVSHDPSGSKVVRLQFVEPCPIALFELAVRGAL
jgi:hypothetical protein